MQPTARPFNVNCRTISRTGLQSRAPLPSHLRRRPTRVAKLAGYIEGGVRRQSSSGTVRAIATRRAFVYTALNSGSFRLEASMDRPIAYDKLAREDRFVRMRAREVAELKVSQGLPPFPDLASAESIKERVHGIMVGELQAMEGAGRSVCDFPDAPWEFTMDMARQVWDESRHVEIYLRLLDHLGGYAGEFPETTILWRCACAEDAAARVAGVNRGLEGLACDVFNQLVHIARKIGDPVLERAVDFVLADEITHVRMGSKWLTKLTEGDAERRRRAIEFQESIDERFNLGGVRREGDHDAVSISIAIDVRRMAGFTEEEIERLIKTTQRSQVY